MKMNNKFKLSLTFAFFMTLALFVAFQAGVVSASSSSTLNVCGSGCSYSSIQAAVNAANPGDTVLVQQGVYTGSVTINKELTLKGLVRFSSPIINGPVLVTSPGVNITELTIVNPSGNYGIKVENAGNVNIINNMIQNIGTTLESGSAEAIEISSNSKVSNFLIKFNSIAGIGSSKLSYLTNSNSAKGVYVDANQTEISGVKIVNNVISSVTASNASWNPSNLGGAGAYGVLVKGNTSGLVVSSNQISNMSGLLSMGVGIEGNTPSAVLTQNSISNLISPSNNSEALAIKSDSSLSTITQSANTLDGNNATLAQSPSLTGFAVSGGSTGGSIFVAVLLILAVGIAFFVFKKRK